MIKKIKFKSKESFNDTIIIVTITLSFIANYIGVNLFNALPLDYLLYFIGCFFLLLVNKGKLTCFNNKTTKYLLLFIILINSTILWSDFKMETIIYSSRFFFLFFLYLLVINISSQSSLKKLFKYIIILTFFFSLVSIINIYFNPNFYYGRFFFLVAKRGDPNFTAHQLFFSIIMTLYFLISQPKKRIYMYILLLCFVFLFLLTKSRGGYIALFLSLLLMYNKLIKKENKKKVNIYIISILSVAVLIILLNYIFNLGLIETNSNFFNLGSAKVRLNLWIDSYDYIIKKPLLGYGGGTYTYILESNYVTHNSFIEILFGGGLCTFYIFVMILFQTVKNYKNVYIKNKLSVYLNWFMLFSLIAMQFLNLETSRLLWLSIAASELPLNKKEFVELNNNSKNTTKRNLSKKDAKVRS